MRILRICVWVGMAAIGIAAAASPAGAADKIGAIYRCPVTAITFDDAGEKTESPLDATLIVEFTESGGGLPVSHLEAAYPEGARFIRLNRASLPEGLSGLLGEADEKYYYIPPVSGNREKQPFVLPLTDSNDPADATSNDAFPFEKLKILDALGRPAEGMIAEFSLDPTANNPLVYSRTIIGPEGWVRTVPPVEARYPGFTLSPKFWHYENFGMRIREPQNGTSQYIEFDNFLSDQMRYGENATYGIFEDEEGNSVLQVALASAEALPKQKTFHGKVVDEDGPAMPFSRLEIWALDLPGMQPINILPPIHLNAAADGSFQFTAPSRLYENNSGELILPDATRIDITAFESGFVWAHSRRIRILTRIGRFTDLVIPRAEYVRFQFLDESGEPLQDLASLYRGTTVKLWYNPGDRKKPVEGRGHVSWVYQKGPHPDHPVDSIVVGPVYVPGYYEAEFAKKRYKGQVLERGVETRTVVWSPLPPETKEVSVYDGRVVSAETHAAVPGTYILAGGNTYDNAWNLSNLPRQDLDYIFADVPQDGKSRNIESDLKEYMDDLKIVGVRTLTRTDAEGQFHITLERENFNQGLIVWAPNMIPVMTSPSAMNDKYATEMPESLTYPDAVLAPAVRVTSRILSPEAPLPDSHLKPGEHTDLSDAIIYPYVTFDYPEDWARPAPSKRPAALMTPQHPWSFVFGKRRWKFDEPFSVFAPAYVPFQLHAFLRTTVLGDVDWDVAEAQSQGDAVELPPRRAPVKTPFRIRIVDETGAPRQGESVMLWGHDVLTTDARGEVVAWAMPGGAVENLCVIKLAEDDSYEVLKRIEEVDIPDDMEDFVYTLILPRKDADNINEINE